MADVTRPASRPTRLNPVDPEQMKDFLRRAKANATQQTQVTYYSSEAKTRLVDEAVVLFLSRAVKETGRFGERWKMTIHEDDPTNPPGFLTLPSNSFRDVLFENYVMLITRIGPIGPLQLTMRETKNGESYDINEWGAAAVDANGDPLPF